MSGGDSSGDSKLKKRGRPRKYLSSGKPIGRPRKYYPPIGDPIKFLQAASLSGLIKVNDENTQISGLSSFLNPKFRNSDQKEGDNVINGKLDEPKSQDDSKEVQKTDENSLKPSFSCQFCGKSYKKKKHYNRHVNFECINTEPRFLCTMCSYRARRKEHLIRHLRSHIGDMITSADYSILAKLEESQNDSPSASDNPVTSSPLLVNKINDQLFNPSFGFNSPLINSEIE